LEWDQASVSAHIQADQAAVAADMADNFGPVMEIDCNNPSSAA
jgi:hypothetical protein